MAMLDVNVTWAAILERLSKGHVEEARGLARELKGQRGASRQAAGEIALRLSACCAAQELTPLITALREIEATWSETVCLLSTSASGPEKWAACAQLAKRASLKEVLEPGKALGLLWNERLDCPSPAELAGEPTEDVEELKSSTDPRERATMLLRSALTQLAQEPPQQKDALKDSKEALATFRDLQLPECEATALLAVSRSCIDFAEQEAFQAALQALKIFRDQGHLKGEIAAMHRLARVDQARKSFDEASYKACEALKLARQMGDRARELALCETLLEVNIAQDRPERALEAAKDAEVLAKIFESQVLLARAKCWIARAFGAYEERKMTGIKAAEEALQIYGTLNQKHGEVEALEALAAATKEDFSDVSSKSQILAEKFAESGDTKEEVQCLLVAASCREGKDSQKAMQLLQRASTAAKGLRALQGLVLLRMARLYLDREEPSEAMRAATQAGSIFRNEPYPTKKIRSGEIECVEIQMDAHVLLGAMDEAFRVGVEQGRRFKGLRERQAEGMILMKLASLHQMRLEEESALKVLQYVPMIFNTVGDRQLEGLAWERIANSYLDAGDAVKALKAMEQCVGNFRKVNSRLMRARAALLQADVQTALVSIRKGSSLDALDAAKEATHLFQNEEAFLARAVQLLTNAHLLNGQAEEALERARESQDLARKQRQIGGEAFSLLMEAGAHLSLQDFGESQRCIRAAKDLFDSDYDESGKRSANDFAAFVQQAESGKEDPAQFRGFGFRRLNATEVRQKAKSAREAQPRRKQKTSEQSDIILWQCDPKSRDNPDGRCIMTIFEGFEVRTGVARGAQQAQPKAPKEEEEGPGTVSADYSKDYKDSVKEQGTPEREPAVFAVRWVQATDDKKEPAKSRRELRRQEDTRVVFTKSLDAPSGCGRYAKSDRLEAEGERHGYRIF